MSKKRVVVLGGGNGSAISIEALKYNLKHFDISAVISMSDSGGSSGRLRREFKTLPPGDIMRAILAMSQKYDYHMLRDIFYKPRFANVGRLNGHNVGNFFLTMCGQYSNNFLYALEALSQTIKAVGKVYPVTLKPSDLVAQLSNGLVIRTESFIDVPSYNRGLKIKKVWLKPKCRVFDQAAKAINRADVILLSPGSLYTSLIATLLPNGVRSAIAKSKAKIVYVVGNAFRTDGETGPEDLSGFVSQLQLYLPRKIDLVVYNNNKLNSTQKKKYRIKRWGTIKFDPKNLPDYKIVAANFERTPGGLDPKKLGVILKKIL